MQALFRMAKKLVTVFGATGVQGGSVINTILSQPSLSQQFTLRGITRNTSSDKAKALAAKGVELAAADLNNPQNLAEVLKGSYGVFAVTNYWETMSSETEISQGKAIADACAAAGVKHLVWSSLPHVTQMTGGVLKHVEHFDSKSKVEEYIESTKKSSSMIATYFMPGFYMSNFRYMTQTNPKVNNGTPTISLPWDAEKTQVGLLDAAQDTGTYVGGILGYPNPAELDGKRIHGVSQWTTPAKIASDLSAVIGQEVKFRPITPEAYQSSLPAESALEMTENMILVRDYSYYGKGTEKEQAESDKVWKALGLKTKTFKEFVEDTSPWVMPTQDSTPSAPGQGVAT